MKTRLSLGYSTCPNDTYIFYALAHNLLKMEDIHFQIKMADVETLNQCAAKGVFDLSKLSFSALGHLTESYSLLRSGAAIGRGCGPLIISKHGNTLDDIHLKEVALPGKWTTAALLLALFLPEPSKAVHMPFDKIMPAVSTGEVDFGVIIHEGRFTFEKYGLNCLVDLGDWWEGETGLPIPLGGIAIRKKLPESVISMAESAVKNSVLYAFDHPGAADRYIREHAQEMDASVIRQHIDLYVNDFTVDIGDEGERAITALFKMAREKKILPENTSTIFADKVKKNDG